MEEKVTRAFTCNIKMKSAYELAMERLNKSSPTTKLTEAKKKQLADLESKYKAKIAEREIALKADIGKAAEAGEFEKAQELEARLVSERRDLQTELEDRKQQLRDGKVSKS